MCHCAGFDGAWIMCFPCLVVDVLSGDECDSRRANVSRYYYTLVLVCWNTKSTPCVTLYVRVIHVDDYGAVHCNKTDVKFYSCERRNSICGPYVRLDGNDRYLEERKL